MVGVELIECFGWVGAVYHCSFIAPHPLQLVLTSGIVDPY